MLDYEFVRLKKQIWWLKWLINKSDFNNDEILVNRNLYFMIDCMENDWVQYEIDEDWFYCRILRKDWSYKYLYNSYFGSNESNVSKVIKDKYYSNWIMAKHWFKVPKSCFSYFKDIKKSEILKFAEEVWFPIIAKPNDEQAWIWIEKIFNDNWLKVFLERFESQEYPFERLIFQQFVDGGDFRVLYLNWEILWVYERKVQQIIWDNNSTIEDLLTNKIELEEINKFAYEKSKKYLISQWYQLDQIISEWEKISILPMNNLSKWWTVFAKNFKSKADQEDYWKLLKLCDDLSQLFWISYFWLDILAKTDLSSWVILEINSSPWIKWFETLDENFRKTLIEKSREYIKTSENIL